MKFASSFSLFEEATRSRSAERAFSITAYYSSEPNLRPYRAGERRRTRGPKEEENLESGEVAASPGRSVYAAVSHREKGRLIP